jgi:hypothetical protein
MPRVYIDFKRVGVNAAIKSKRPENADDIPQAALLV